VRSLELGIVAAGRDGENAHSEDVFKKCYETLSELTQLPGHNSSVRFKTTMGEVTVAKLKRYCRSQKRQLVRKRLAKRRLVVSRAE